ncbi:MAG: hypothetical protein JW981_04915, partial [Anaerolineae bacterium]|nr:hypothetical protein [Anaerolineae bacterium]
MDTTSPVEILIQFAPLLLPIVILIIIGLSAWLAITLIRRFGKSGRDTPKSEGVSISGSHGAGGLQLGQTSTPPLLTVHQTPAGEWAISVHGTQYYKLEAVPNEQVRQQVVQGIRALAAFARDYVKKQQEQPAKPQETRPSPVIQQPQAPASAPAYDKTRQSQPQPAAPISRPPAATAARPPEPAPQ